MNQGSLSREMNYLTKPFGNIKIRQAFALAINRDVLNQTLLKNTVSRSWSFIPLWQPKNDVAIKTYLKGLTNNGLVIIPPNDWASIYVAQQ